LARPLTYDSFIHYNLPVYPGALRKAGLPPLFEFVSLRLMARKWSNQNLPGALHYVTGNLLDRVPPLRVDQEWWWADDSEKLSKAMKELGWRSYEKRNE
jgi:hypothetical protein